MNTKPFPLTIFYDSFCPLCVAEMKQLSELDSAHRLRLEDIHAPEFTRRFPHIDVKAAGRVLHAQYANGELIFGLDVTHQSWAAVGRKRWIAILRWPVIRWFSNLGYRLFARYRYEFSYLLTGTRRCERCVTGIGETGAAEGNSAGQHSQ